MEKGEMALGQNLIVATHDRKDFARRWRYHERTLGQDDVYTSDHLGLQSEGTAIWPRPEELLVRKFQTLVKMLLKTLTRWVLSVSVLRLKKGTSLNGKSHLRVKKTFS